MSALVYGLDIHKESTYATILGPDGEIVTQRRMPNEEVPDFLKSHDVEKVAMEPPPASYLSTESSPRRDTTSPSPTPGRPGT